MDTPFIYDRFVTGKNFIGRKTECTILGNLIAQGEHISIIGPPRSGKTSIIQQTLLNARMGGFSFQTGLLSAFNIRSKEQFLQRFGAEVIRMFAATPDEYAALVNLYLGGTHFLFDADAFARSGEIISLSWDVDESDMNALMRLPFALARERQVRLVMIIDEFQNIDRVEGGDALFRAMGTAMREDSGKMFSLILTGSKVNAMEEILYRRTCFARLVERLPVQPVDERMIVDHLVKGFLSSGKVIDRNLLLGACHLFRNHLYYINYFVSLCDSRSKGYIMEPVLVEALQAMVAVFEPGFRAIMDDLTAHQVQMLLAILEGNTRFSSAETVRKYHLNSSANVKRVKEALMKKEVVTFDERDTPQILDPLFEYWVRKFYFEFPE